MTFMIIIYTVCAGIPILIYRGLAKTRKFKYILYDYAFPAIIVSVYFVISYFGLSGPKSLANFSLELFYIFISLLVYGLSGLLKSRTLLGKAILSIIPIAALIYVNFFVGFLYE